MCRAYTFVPLELCSVAILPLQSTGMSRYRSCVSLSRLCLFCLTQYPHPYSGNLTPYSYESNLLTQNLAFLFKFCF